jgi:predicted ester cyclase
MSLTNTELVRRHFEQMWNQRDLSACDDLMAEEYVEHARAPFGTTEPGRVHGPTAMRDTITWLLDQFPDIQMEVQAVVSEGDLVAARVRSTGSNLGRLNGRLPPSGKKFDSVQTHWFRVAEGRLAEHWATRDDLTTMLQLGVVRPPRLATALRQVVGSIRFRRVAG